MTKDDADRLEVTMPTTAPRNRVWETLTHGRERWWPDMMLEATVGAPVQERWSVGDREFVAHGTVAEVEAGSTLGFVWAEPEWNSSLRVTFTLTSANDTTLITIAESGFAALADGPELLAEHTDGWRDHLANLCREAVR